MDPFDLWEEGLCLYLQGHAQGSGVSRTSSVQIEGPPLVGPRKAEEGGREEGNICFITM